MDVRINYLASVIIITTITSSVFGQNSNEGLTQISVSNDDLINWELRGLGEVGKLGNQAFLKEIDGSQGVMLISPETYGPEIIVRYKVLALTPATVIVTMLSVSDMGASTELSVPQEYNGSIGLWNKEKESYFFAFKNAPHGVKPFVKKNPNADKPLVSASENIMLAGVYYQVEIGSRKGKLWLKVDGNTILETEDKQPLQGGRVALRLRGTAGFNAGVVIQDFEITGSKL